MRRQQQKRRKKATPSLDPPTNPESSARASTPSNTGAKELASYEETREWSLLFANVVRDISEASGMLSPLKSTMALVIRGLEITRDLNDNTGAWKDLEDDLQTQLKQIEEWTTELEHENREVNTLAQTALRNYNEAIVEIKEKADETTLQSQRSFLKAIRRFGSVKLEQETINDLTRRIEKAFKGFSEAMGIALSRQLSDLKEHLSELQLDVRQQIQDIKSDMQINYGTVDSFLQLSYGRDLERCEQGTRLEVLATIRQWSEYPSYQKQIFWLKDAAGTGKSTIAATMADEWMRAKRLAARFFFSPNSSATSVTDHFSVTLAKDMAVQIPSLSPSIHSAVRESPPSHFNFQQQLERLFFDPLRKASVPSTVILVIDALDNCDLEGRAMLLEYLISSLPSIGNLKVLITSRPLPDIDLALSGSNMVHGHEVQLLDIHDKVYEDIKFYVNKRLPKLTPDQRQKVIIHSGGLFIWVATACRMLKTSRRPIELLAELLRSETHAHLDHLYLKALQQALTDPSAHNLMMDVLRLVIAAFQPISISTIEAFLPENKDVNIFVQDLGGVLKDGHPDRPIFVIHPTFREFLFHSERANGFIVDMPSSHGMLAMACIDLLANLEYDSLRVRRLGEMIPLNFEVEDLESRINRCIGAAIKYASSYWAQHVAASQESRDAWENALHLLGTKILPWIELMSWRDSLPGCLEGLSQLFFKSKKLRLTDEAILTSENVLDVTHAYQFVLQNQRMLQESALHTYSTALAFSPTTSPLFHTYRTLFKSRMPVVVSNTDVHWPTHQILTGHSDISQIELSLDGGCIVSRSGDGSLYLWDADSGAIISRTGSADASLVVHFAFSPDGKRLAFVTASCHVNIWNLHGAAKIIRPFDISPGSACQIAFSPAQPFIIVGIREPTNEIRIWDWEKRELVGSLDLEGPIRFFSVSPSGQTLVSICQHHSRYPDVVVNLWDLDSLDIITETTMPRIGYDPCVEFDHADTRYMTWDAEGTIYLRHLAINVPPAMIRAHKQGVSGAQFSPKGRYVASYGSFDSSLALWDTQHGNTGRALIGHTGRVHYITFSSDEKHLASIASDQTVRVWDVDTGSPIQSIFRGYTGYLKFCILSQDWSKLVTVSGPSQINVYDLIHDAEGENVPESAGGSSNPHFGFSPSDKLLVCGFHGHPHDEKPALQLWDIETALPVGQPMPGLMRGISAVIFSPDGRRIASGLREGLVLLWDTYTQLEVGNPMKGHSNEIRCLVFSSDGRRLASSSFDHINIWDTESTANIWSLEREQSVTTVALSLEGTKIAGFDYIRADAGYEFDVATKTRSGKMIAVWDYTTGESKLRKITKTHADALVFSSTKGLLASSHHDHIQLWEVKDAIIPIAEITLGPDLQLRHVTEPYPLGFSSDGTLLAYGHSVWNIISLPPRKLSRTERPSSLLEPGGYEHSLLAYVDGWIYSAWPQGRLMPIPQHLRDQFKRWRAGKNRMVVWIQSRQPIVMDCSHLLS